MTLSLVLTIRGATSGSVMMRLVLIQALKLLTSTGCLTGKPINLAIFVSHEHVFAPIGKCLRMALSMKFRPRGADRPRRYPCRPSLALTSFLGHEILLLLPVFSGSLLDAMQSGTGPGPPFDAAS